MVGLPELLIIVAITAVTSIPLFVLVAILYYVRRISLQKNSAAGPR